MLSKMLTPEGFQLPPPLDSTNYPPPAPPKFLKHQVYDTPFVFAKVDAHAIRVSQSEYPTFRDLMWDLVFRYKLSDLEKARVIFRWMTSKDMNSIDFKDCVPDSAEDVLTSFRHHRGTFAHIFQVMCRYSGLYCLTITGHAKGVEYLPGDTFAGKSWNHSWNVIYIQGAWQLIDAHWATRYLSSTKNVPQNVVYEYDDFYFIMEPQQAVYSHYPEQPEWQLMTRPLTLTQFENLPLTKSQFFKCGMDFLQQHHGVVCTQAGKLQMTLGFWRPDCFTYKLQFGEKLAEQVNGVDLKMYVLQECARDTLNYYFRLPKSGFYYLTIYAQDLSGEAGLSHEVMYRAACEYKLICDAAAPDACPYPAGQDSNWGAATPSVGHYGLVPARQEGVISVSADSGQGAGRKVVELRMGKTRPEVSLLAKLHRNGIPDEVFEEYVEETVTVTEVVLTITLVEPGEYGLELYANEPSQGDTYSYMCQYMLQYEAPPDYRAPVQGSILLAGGGSASAVPGSVLTMPGAGGQATTPLREMYNYELYAPSLGALPRPYTESQYPADSVKQVRAGDSRSFPQQALPPPPSNGAARFPYAYQETYSGGDDDGPPDFLPPPPPSPPPPPPPPSAPTHQQHAKFGATPLPPPPPVVAQSGGLNDSFQSLANQIVQTRIQPEPVTTIPTVSITAGLTAGPHRKLEADVSVSAGPSMVHPAPASSGGSASVPGRSGEVTAPSTFSVAEAFGRDSGNMLSTQPYLARVSAGASPTLVRKAADGGASPTLTRKAADGGAGAVVSGRAESPSRVHGPGVSGSAAMASPERSRQPYLARLDKHPTGPPPQQLHGIRPEEPGFSLPGYQVVTDHPGSKSAPGKKPPGSSGGSQPWAVTEETVMMPATMGSYGRPGPSQNPPSSMRTSGPQSGAGGPTQSQQQPSQAGAGGSQLRGPYSDQRGGPGQVGASANLTLGKPNQQQQPPTQPGANLSGPGGYGQPAPYSDQRGGPGQFGASANLTLGKPNQQQQPPTQPGANLSGPGGWGQPAPYSDQRGGPGQFGASANLTLGKPNQQQQPPTQPGANLSGPGGYGQPAPYSDQRGGPGQVSTGVNLTLGRPTQLQPVSSSTGPGGYGQPAPYSDQRGGPGQVSAGVTLTLGRPNLPQQQPSVPETTAVVGGQYQPGVTGQPGVTMGQPVSVGGRQSDQYNKLGSSDRSDLSPVKTYRPELSTANWTKGPVQREPPKEFIPKLVQPETAEKPAPATLPPELGASAAPSHTNLQAFQRIDEHALDVSKQQQTSFNELIWQLIYARNITDEVEKVRAIFLWLCTKDLHKMNFSNVVMGSPEEILLGINTGKSTYAQIFLTLCGYAELHCKLIVGYAKGAEYVPGMTFSGRQGQHSWNAVQIGGLWRLVDCHWAARRLIGKQASSENVRYELDTFYFLANPSQLIYTHFPLDADWQLLRHPITQKDFESLAPVKSAFFKYNLELITHRNAVITCTTPEVMVAISCPPVDEETIPVAFTFTFTFTDGGDMNGNIPLARYGRQEIVQSENCVRFYLRPPKPTAYKLLVYSKQLSGEAGGDSLYGAVCEYKLEANFSPQHVLPPFPPCQTSICGPNEEVLRRYRVQAQTAEPTIRANRGTVELRFTMPNSTRVRMMAKLKSSQLGEDALARCILQRTVADREAVFAIFLPDAGEFGLEMYVNDPDKDGNSFYAVWQYLIVADSASPVRGLPTLHPVYLGPSPKFFEYGLEAVSHTDPFLQANTGDLCIQFRLRQPLRLMSQLIHASHDVNEDCTQQVLQQSKESNVFFVIRFPHVGFFKLQIYASPYSEQSESLPGVFNYLIETTQAARCPLPFPLQYAQWKEGCYLHEPLDGRLGGGGHEPAYQNFSMTVPNAMAVAVVAGDDWTQLEKAGQDAGGARWEGKVAMDKCRAGRVRQISICVNYGSYSSNYTTILEYSLD